jgi:hypothetical protein
MAPPAGARRPSGPSGMSHAGLFSSPPDNWRLQLEDDRRRQPAAAALAAPGTARSREPGQDRTEEFVFQPVGFLSLATVANVVIARWG